MITKKCSVCRKDIDEHFFLYLGRKVSKNIEERQLSFDLCKSCYELIDMQIKELVDANIIDKYYRGVN